MGRTDNVLPFNSTVLFCIFLCITLSSHPSVVTLHLQNWPFCLPQSCYPSMFSFYLCLCAEESHGQRHDVIILSIHPIPMNTLRDILHNWHKRTLVFSHELIRFCWSKVTLTYSGQHSISRTLGENFITSGCTFKYKVFLVVSPINLSLLLEINTNTNVSLFCPFRQWRKSAKPVWSIQSGSRDTTLASSPGSTLNRLHYPASHSLSSASSMLKAWRILMRAVWLRPMREKTATNKNKLTHTSSCIHTHEILQGYMDVW